MFANFVRSQRVLGTCRLIPVSSVGPGFVREDGNTMRKIPGKVINPFRVGEVPIACALPDALNGPAAQARATAGPSKLLTWARGDEAEPRAARDRHSARSVRRPRPPRRTRARARPSPSASSSASAAGRRKGLSVSSRNPTLSPSCTDRGAVSANREGVAVHGGRSTPHRVTRRSWSPTSSPIPEQAYVLEYASGQESADPNVVIVRDVLGATPGPLCLRLPRGRGTRGPVRAWRDRSARG